MAQLVTAIVMKCPKKYAKPGRKWCVLKHPKNSKTFYEPQPKGWPKTYKTKKDAEHGVKMMKTFKSGSIPTGWYINTLLPEIGALYMKKPNILNNRKRLLANVSNQAETFLECYPEELATLQHWAPRSQKLHMQSKFLKAFIQVCTKKDSAIITSMYNIVCSCIDIRILQEFYNKNAVQTAQLGLYATKFSSLRFDIHPVTSNPDEKTLDEGSGLAPNRGMGDIPRRFYNNVKEYLCPDPNCRLKLFKDMKTCPHCGQNPRISLQPIQDELAQQEIQNLMEYLGEDGI